MKIYYSPQCLDYWFPGHPESPDRLRYTVDLLRKNGYSFETPEPCSDEDILRVHSKDMLDSLKSGSFFDVDTPVLPHIIDYAMLSAGSAIQTCNIASEGDHAFSMMRPPGHHACRTAVMGFCYMNNMAAAVASYLNRHEKAKVAILDIDCHHGNGTEDIFSGNTSVLYISLHQSPAYPGTGLESRQNCLNYPLPPGTEESDYIKILESSLEKINNFNPSLIGISAGFDTYKKDPLLSLGLEIGSYQKISQRIAKLKISTFSVLEGGYSSDLPQCVMAYLRGF